MHELFEDISYLNVSVEFTDQVVRIQGGGIQDWTASLSDLGDTQLLGELKTLLSLPQCLEVGAQLRECRVLGVLL